MATQYERTGNPESTTNQDTAPESPADVHGYNPTRLVNLSHIRGHRNRQTKFEIGKSGRRLTRMIPLYDPEKPDTVVALPRWEALAFKRYFGYGPNGHGGLELYPETIDSDSPELRAKAREIIAEWNRDVQLEEHGKLPLRPPQEMTRLYIRTHTELQQMMLDGMDKWTNEDLIEFARKNRLAMPQGIKDKRMLVEVVRAAALTALTHGGATLQFPQIANAMASEGAPSNTSLPGV